jgi:hypothetical protein
MGQMALSRSNSRRVETAFAIYLRTGYRAAPGIELKFNPWHDTGNGRFTFVGQGRYYGNGHVAQEVPQRDREAAAKDIHDAYGGRRVPSTRDPYVPDYGDASPWHPANWKVYTVGPGDSLTSIARMRKGLTVDDLAWFNRIPIGKLRVGQTLMLPTQRSLDDGRDAYQKSLALILYTSTHGNKSPPIAAKLPSIEEQINETRSRISKNGYQYELDFLLRTKRVTGTLVLNPKQGRDRKVQSAAGGSDRLATDHGGHFIARRFNGPMDAFNHFAQDSSFNMEDYASLERGWAAQMRAGHQVKVDIRASYVKASLRPSMITVQYWVDGHYKIRYFSNTSRGKKS